MGLQQVPAISPVISVDGTVGRVTSSGGTAPILDLATSGVSATTYGSASLIPSLTVDAYGRVTSATTNAFSAGAMSLIGSQTVNSGNITFSSIPAHKSLVAHINAVSSSNTPLRMQVNGVTSSSYVSNAITYQAATPGVTILNPNGGSTGSQTGDAWVSGRFFVNGATYSQVITFPNSGASRTFKTFFSHGNYDGNSGVVTPYVSNGILTLGSAGAITTITFNIAAGGSSVVDLYAMN